MLDLQQYMKKVDVSKKEYVDRWIDEGLIPGATRKNGIYSFPDSARRPYCDGHVNPNLPASKIRAHIIKAVVSRRHISASTFFMSNGEFEEMIKDLSEAELVRVRIEDSITYYDSTSKADTYKGKKLQFIQKSLETLAKGVAEGVATALINRLIPQQ